jgi:hypothetical protein
MTDFCLESRETRLGRVVSYLLLELKLEGKPVVFHDITLSQFPQEIFVMGDDDQLEIRVALTLVDDTADIKVRLYPARVNTGSLY